MPLNRLEHSGMLASTPDTLTGMCVRARGGKANMTDTGRVLDAGCESKLLPGLWPNKNSRLDGAGFSPSFLCSLRRKLPKLLMFFFKINLLARSGGAPLKSQHSASRGRRITEFDTSPGYVVNSRSASTTVKTLSQKNKTKQTKKINLSQKN